MVFCFQNFNFLRYFWNKNPKQALMPKVPEKVIILNIKGLQLQAPQMSKKQSLSSSKTPIQGVERQGYPQQGRWSKNIINSESVVYSTKMQCD